MTRAATVGRALELTAGLALAVLASALLCGCGAHTSGSARTAASAASGAAGSGYAIGLTEDNANLLSASAAAREAGAATSSPSAGQASARFALAREQLTALHPRYLRLLIDWAALEPYQGRAPALDAPVSGCARAIAPCAPYAGVRDELAAIASQQHAAGGAKGAFEVVIDIFGTPAWAARAPSGCERSGRGAFSRAPSAAGIAAYRGLIHALIALAASEGVALDWWTPWNEPNDPVFLSPQRASCSAGAAALSPSAYAELARAMAAQLRAEGGERHLLLGELNAYHSGAFDRTSIAEFTGAVPGDVACLDKQWSLHAYASRGSFAPAVDPVRELEAALDARGGCARGARVWVTEAGAGAAHPGLPWSGGAAEEAAGCLALARQLLGWYRDPRVGAVFQYTFREDPAFPVGLISPQLSRAYASYRLWLAWARARAAGKFPPPPPVACAGSRANS